MRLIAHGPIAAGESPRLPLLSEVYHLQKLAGSPIGLGASVRVASLAFLGRSSAGLLDHCDDAA